MITSKPILAAVIAAFVISITGCGSSPEETIEFTIVQMNDVYETAPVQDGTKGGLARVATIIDSLKRENPNTISVLAGDFLAPSLLSNQKDSTGTKIYGAQMIEALNTMGLDYAVFGNHEFDTKDTVLLQDRLDKAAFTFVCANVQRLHLDGSIAPFKQDGTNIADYVIHEFDGKGGTKLKLALVGTMLTENKQPYLHYDEPLAAFAEAAAAAQSEADLLIALTHLNLGQDIELARQNPNLSLIMGGHEHHHIDTLTIRKADSNAKTIYVHKFEYNIATKAVRVVSHLIPVTDQIREQPATKVVVDRWQQNQASLLQASSINSENMIYTAKSPLIGRDAIIRNKQTNLGDLILQSYEWAYPKADLYFFNSGAVRLDDDLYGPITELDVARTLHFGDRVVKSQLPGSKLMEALNRGKTPGNGFFLQLRGVFQKNGEWILDRSGQAIQSDRTYEVATRGYIAEGGDGYEMLKNGTIVAGHFQSLSIPNDERLILINFLKENAESN